MKENDIHVEGIMCEGCVNRIKNVLENIKDLKYIETSIPNKNVKIKVKSENVLQEAVDAINDLGFKVIEN